MIIWILFICKSCAIQVRADGISPKVICTTVIFKFFTRFQSLFHISLFKPLILFSWSTVIIAGIIYCPPKYPVANMVQSDNLKSTWCKWSLSGSDFWNFANCQSIIPIGEFFWMTLIVSFSINTVCLWYNWQFAMFIYCRLVILRKVFEKIVSAQPWHLICKPHSDWMNFQYNF